jgi:hypothetical protein
MPNLVVNMTRKKHRGFQRLLRMENSFIIQALVPSSFCGHLTTIVSLRKARNIQGNVFVIIAICSKFIELVFEGAGVVWVFQ